MQKPKFEKMEKKETINVFPTLQVQQYVILYFFRGKNLNYQKGKLKFLTTSHRPPSLTSHCIEL